MSAALDIGVVVAISVLSAVFIAALVALVVVLKKRYCKPVDLITQQYRDIEPDVDLVTHIDEPPEVELDDVGLRRNFDEILNNEIWANDAAGLMPHCLAILRTAHQLTDKLVSVTLTNANQLQFPETLTDLVAVAKRIGSRVDDVVRALYPPLDPRLLEARCSSLMLSVSHLAMLAKSAGGLSGLLDWIDQSLADVEEHLKVLSEASLAYEAGLNQRTASNAGHSSSANVCMDNWEKFSVDEDVSTGAEASGSGNGGTGSGLQQQTVEPVIRESSQV